ncbi:hypothetical protein [Nocardioides convexus]|uniref:hypothetical protein n=1 Tax=Nocardioides convexus TaxID=2712224 RepID=UPI0024189A7D|nr:hypothetical protein [Nocardioides convexus]
MPASPDRVLADRLAGLGVTVRVQDDAAWRRVLTTQPPARVRLLGGSRSAFAEASGGRVDVALYAQPVLEAGRVEPAALPARAGGRGHRAPVRLADPAGRGPVPVARVRRGTIAAWPPSISSCARVTRTSTATG